MPLPKLALLITTSVCGLVAWGLNRVGDAYFVINLYHAVQYFAIVWALEGRGEGTATYWLRAKAGRVFGFMLFVSAPLAFGTIVEFTAGHRTILALIIAVGLLHFWYDGFIWSVRRKQV